MNQNILKRYPKTRIDLPVVVARSALLLKSEGTMRMAIPNEGTLLWKFGAIVIGHEFKKRDGFSYQVLMRYGHANTAADIEGVLEVFSANAKCQVFGVYKAL